MSISIACSEAEQVLEHKPRVKEKRQGTGRGFTDNHLSYTCREEALVGQASESLADGSSDQRLEKMNPHHDSNWKAGTNAMSRGLIQKDVGMLPCLRKSTYRIPRDPKI